MSKYFLVLLAFIFTLSLHAQDQMTTSAENAKKVELLNNQSNYKLSIKPNEAFEFVAFQVKGMVKRTLEISILNTDEEIMSSAQISPGSTMCIIDLRTFYDGTYTVKLQDGTKHQLDTLIIQRD